MINFFESFKVCHPTSKNGFVFIEKICIFERCNNIQSLRRFNLGLLETPNDVYR